MTKYIQDPKTGQLKGSIGDGKTRIPATDAPVPARPSTISHVDGSSDYSAMYQGFTLLNPNELPESPDHIVLYEVGGCVRDFFLGQNSKDIDFTVEAPSYKHMKEFLQKAGFEIFLESPEFLTIRARFPRNPTHPAIPTRFLGEKQLPTADFVLARKETTYSDGRHPDEVLPGSILDDLARRDFSVNAIARDKDGNFLDPHNGRADLALGVLRAVGDPDVRIREDALRALRAIRFSITKNLTPDDALNETLRAEWLPPLLASVSAERRREELDKAFKADTIQTLNVLYSMPAAFREAVFTDGLRLKPTMEA